MKKLEQILIKLESEMGKNRVQYEEARGNYSDTGYDRYYNKMNRLDAEYAEMEKFLNPMPVIGNSTEVNELKKMLADVKNLVSYIHADYWSDPYVLRLYEMLKDFRGGNGV